MPNKNIDAHRRFLTESALATLDRAEKTAAELRSAVASLDATTDAEMAVALRRLASLAATVSIDYHLADDAFYEAARAYR